MDKIPQQEDISRYDRKYSVAVGVPEPTVAPSVIDFPKFEQPEPQAKKEAQTPIEVPQPIDVGSKTFNVNDLINKGLYDAAEYFLGRPLTSGEKTNGLSAKSEKETVATDSMQVNIAKLVKNSEEQLAVLKAAAEERDDRKDRDPPVGRVLADGEEKEELEDQAARVSQVNADDIADAKLREFAETLREQHPFLGVRKTRARNAGILSKVSGLTPAELRDRIRKAQWQVVQREAEQMKEIERQHKQIKDPDVRRVMEQVDDILASPTEAAAHELPEDSDDETVQVGSGAKRRLPRGKTPLDWRPFGKYLIARDRLEKDDVFSMVSKNRMRLNRYPTKTVTAPVKVCLLEWIDGKPMSEALLSPDDKEWLDWILHQAEAKRMKKKPDKLVVPKTAAQIRDRISVLMGEIAMGDNDNPLLKTELKTLYQQAVMRDALSEEKQAILKDFISSF